MSKNKVGVAVAGLGFVGRQAHVPSFRKIPDAELVAVIDVIEKVAKEVGTKHNVKYYLDYKEALKNPKIDALVVAVPTPFHYDLVSDALANGKHVLCEMPLTPTVAESEKLDEEATKAGVILMPDLNFRFTPNYVKAKDLIEDGAIGKPIAVTFSEFIPAKDLAAQWPSGSWAWDVVKSGGYPDFTLSVWSLDLVRWLFDAEIVDAKWMSNYAPLPDLDNYIGYNTAGIIKLSNNATGTLYYSASVSPGEGTSRLEVFGDNTKTLKARWNNHLTLTGEGLKAEWEFKERGTKVWGHYQIDSYFVNCILNRERPTVTVEDAIKVQNIAKKIVESERPRAC